MAQKFNKIENFCILPFMCLKPEREESLHIKKIPKGKPKAEFWCS
jgi:hypothetical protein